MAQTPLSEHMQAADETVRAYARQIDSGNYDDEPIVEETPISEYPFEVIDERGREFAVVLRTGDPHIEVAADGLHDARLEGYWAGEHITFTGEHYSTFLEYFIVRE